MTTAHRDWRGLASFIVLMSDRIRFSNLFIIYNWFLCPVTFIQCYLKFDLRFCRVPQATGSACPACFRLRKGDRWSLAWPAGCKRSVEVWIWVARSRWACIHLWQGCGDDTRCQDRFRLPARPGSKLRQNLKGCFQGLYPCPILTLLHQMNWRGDYIPHRDLQTL